MISPFGRLTALSLTVAAGALLAGCDDSYLDSGPGRSERPISSATLEQMSKIDTTPSSPVLVRTYKKEAELELWKMKSDGRYALLKTYPICRWSGQLGPKKVEGDMQVPEGFYTIAPGQMNPNSHYYLAFNVGYPNAYDRAYGRTGGSVMVHGVCSSAGCFSMTDEQVADIYAIARDAFRGGQRQIQLQSYPFRMTAENMTKYRLDPNIAFWKELKNGSDHFEVGLTEPSVVVCGKHYVFGATPKGAAAPTEPCPAMQRDDDLETLVAEKESKDNAKVAELAASGVKAVRTVYADGGQNPVFAGYRDTSDPEALAGGPQEIALGESAKPAPAVVKVAASDRRRAAAATVAQTEVAPPAADGEAKPQTVAVAAPASSDQSGVWGSGTRNVKRWLHLGGPDQPVQPTAAAYVPDEAAAPLPPRRDDKPLHVALKVPPTPPSKSEDTQPAAAATAPAQ
jgi:murein L,D-transpeptidase YafK